MSRDGDKLAGMHAMDDGATSKSALTQLRDKYAALIALRTEHATGAPPPRDELRALANRFPGALRELDQRAMHDLVARRDQLEAHLTGRAPDLPGWAVVQVRYHGLLRAVLRLKAARAWSPAEAGRVLSDLFGQGGVPPLSFWGPARLAQVREPAGGRINPVVVRWVAEIGGLPEAQVAAQLFPTHPQP